MMRVSGVRARSSGHETCSGVNSLESHDEAVRRPTRGRDDLPAEHGFRFFPGFYRHLPDTLQRIPDAGNRRGVLDNLVPATRILLAQSGGRNELLTAAHLPESLDDFAVVTPTLGDGHVGGILSVDVSDWQQPGRRFAKVAAQRPKRSRRRSGSSSRLILTTTRTPSSTTPTSPAGSSTRPSSSPIPPRPRTWSRCSSTPPGPGQTARTR